MKEILGRLEKWLATHRKRFLGGLRPGASAAELAALEKGLGLAVPEDLKTLLAWHNGQREDFVGRFEENWLLMNTESMVAAKQELDREANTTGWSKNWVPFLDNDAGDYLCLDTSQTGTPVRGFWLGNRDHSIVAKSLAAWLDDFVHNVEKGKYCEDPERGTFLRGK